MSNDLIDDYIEDILDGIYPDENGMPEFDDVDFAIAQIDDDIGRLQAFADLIDTSQYSLEEIKEHLIRKGWKNE